jgi:hypothetical protein
LQGTGGVGKTQLASEYVHQYATEYDVTWWVAAERADLIDDQFAALAQEFGCAPSGSPQTVVRKAVLMLASRHPYDPLALLLSAGEGVPPDCTHSDLCVLRLRAGLIRMRAVAAGES